MKRPWNFVLILLLTVPSISAADEPANNGPAAGRAVPAQILERFDANGDGKLDEGERAKAREAFAERAPGGVDYREMLKKFDGDGRLNEQERAEARRAMMQQMQQRQAGNGGARRPGGRRPGNGNVVPPQVLQRFDNNQNGRLDPEEAEAARAAFRQRGRMMPGGNQNPQARQWMKQFDRDGNGTLDEQERAALREAMMQRMRAGNGRPDRPARPAQAGNAPQQPEPGRRPATANPQMPDAMRQAILNRFDENKNGRLDPEEQQKLRQMAQRRGQGRGAAVLGGLVDAEPEATLDTTDVLKKYDKNQDGQLDPAERKQALLDANKPQD